jgi:hypothetical protein
MAFDASKVGINDWIIIGCGIVLLVFSFFGWLSVSFTGVFGANGGGSTGAWNQYWWLATVLGVAVSVIVALRAAFNQDIKQIKPLYLVIGAGAGFVITLIALIEIFISYTSSDQFSSSGPGLGIWVSLVVSLVQTYFVWLWAQKQPGTALPKIPGPAF